jgi:ribosomal protein S18 acetylase RimI-like enzyme
MQFRRATAKDIPELAKFNAQLNRDDASSNKMTEAELEARMNRFFDQGYIAVIFSEDDATVGYVLYRSDDDSFFIRQFFVAMQARRKGLGKQAVKWLQENMWKDGERITVQVMVGNKRGLEFWRAVGFVDYSMMMELLPTSGK